MNWALGLLVTHHNLKTHFSPHKIPWLQNNYKKKDENNQKPPFEYLPKVSSQGVINLVKGPLSLLNSRKDMAVGQGNEDSRNVH